MNLSLYINMVYFSLASLSNGISTYSSYSMPKPFF